MMKLIYKEIDIQRTRYTKNQIYKELDIQRNSSIRIDFEIQRQTDLEHIEYKDYIEDKEAIKDLEVIEDIEEIEPDE